MTTVKSTTDAPPTPRAAAPAELPAGISPLLTRSGLAAYYEVSLWTVNQWMQRGCPTEPIAVRGPRFDLDRVRAWMAANTEAA